MILLRRFISASLAAQWGQGASLTVLGWLVAVLPLMATAELVAVMEVDCFSSVRPSSHSTETLQASDINFSLSPPGIEP